MSYSTLLRTAPLASALALVACGNNATHPDPLYAYDSGVATPLQCVPTLDGNITAAQLTPVLDTPVQYQVNPAGTTETVDLVGATDSSGQLVWDWGTSLAQDETIAIEATPLASKWYATSFPGGTFATPFDAGDTLEAVYHADDNGIWLHGIASTQQNPSNGKTLYAYEQPVEIIQFPLSVGAHWVSSGTVINGMLEGLPYASVDTYDVTDDATGELILPVATFTQAHRVRTLVTLSPAAGETVTSWQVSFYFQCFGEVARATSQTNENDENFTTAAEVRRYGFAQ
jgi:hypothetical protein